MFLKRLLAVCVFAMILYLAFPPSAHAYLDPGTGSFIFQLLIAGLAGVAFLVKVYWNKIMRFVSRRDTSEDQDQQETVNEEGNV
jgi:hypothetical protein